MTEDITTAIIRLLNNGADPQDVRILTDAIPGAEFIPVEDFNRVERAEGESLATLDDFKLDEIRIKAASQLLEANPLYLRLASKH